MTLPVPEAPGTRVIRSAGASLAAGRAAGRDEAALYGLAGAVPRGLGRRFVDRVCR